MRDRVENSVLRRLLPFRSTSVAVGLVALLAFAVAAALLAATLVLPGVVALVGAVPTAPLALASLVIAAVSPLAVPLLTLLLALLTVFASAAVLAIHVLVFAQLAGVGPSLALLLVTLLLTALLVAPLPGLSLIGLLLTRLSLAGLLMLGVTVPDVLVCVGIVVLARPLLTGPSRAVPAVRGVSAPLRAVGHLLVLVLPVVLSASPAALGIS